MGTVYAFIEAEKTTHGIALMCQLLSSLPLTRSGAEKARRRGGVLAFRQHGSDGGTVIADGVLTPLTENQTHTGTPLTNTTPIAVTEAHRPPETAARRLDSPARAGRAHGRFTATGPCGSCLWCGGGQECGEDCADARGGVEVVPGVRGLVEDHAVEVVEEDAAVVQGRG